MTVDVELFDDLDAVARDAAGALERESQPHLYDRLDWFRLIAAETSLGAKPVIARAAQDGARAWLFLVDAGGRRGEALANWYTLAFRAVFDGHPDEAERRALITAIARVLATRFFDRLTIAPLYEPDLAVLSDGFAATGWRGRVSETTVNWRADVADQSFDDYWQARPGELRGTVRRKAATESLAYNLIDRFEPDLWDAYERVYARSWKPAEGSPAFLRALAEREGAAGTLRLGLLTRNEAPIAAQFWLVENKIATIHKLAYAEDAKAFSPGTLLTAAMFRFVIERDCPALIDYGTGDDAYKADWMDRREPMFRLDLTRTGTAADWIAAGRSILARLVRGSAVD